MYIVTISPKRRKIDMRRKTLLTTVIIAVALVGCNKAGAGVSSN